MRPSCPTPAITTVAITTVAITATASTTGQTRGNYLITAPGELPDRSQTRQRGRYASPNAAALHITGARTSPVRLERVGVGGVVLVEQLPAAAPLALGPRILCHRRYPAARL